MQSFSHASRKSDAVLARNEWHRRSPIRAVARLLRATAFAYLLCLCAPSIAHAEQRFDSPASAMNALGDAIADNNEDTLKTLFGNDFRTLIPPVGADIRARFLDAWNASHTIGQHDDKHAQIAVGNDGWTFPIPLVKADDGWHFDMHAGAEVMRLRRIGRNELAVIQTMLAVYDAQREYASTAHDGASVLAYASKLVSSPGKQDGLYWPTPDGAPESPLGPAFIRATSHSAADTGYHGYHYRLLKSQGPHAPGGAYDYVAHGKLFGGFAVIAWPVRYGDTGIKTFIVSHAGQVYERDLGPDSARKAQQITSFDPAPGWLKVNPPEP